MVKSIHQKIFTMSSTSNRSNSMHFSSQKGLTLLELMFVVTIVGILGMVAIPSFSQQIKQNRLVSNANQLQSVFKFARSEAAKRNKSILLRENSGDWEVVLDGTIIQNFSSTSDTIKTPTLGDLTILNTGEITFSSDSVSSINYQITDDDSDTIDYCFSVLLSGQAFLTNTNSC